MSINTAAHAGFQSSFPPAVQDKFRLKRFQSYLAIQLWGGTHMAYSCQTYAPSENPKNGVSPARRSQNIFMLGGL